MWIQGVRLFLFALSIIIYLLKEISEKWGISTRRIQDLCKESRIPGIIMIGRTWGILEDAEKPADARSKSEKYVKWPCLNNTYGGQIMSNFEKSWLLSMLLQSLQFRLSLYL